MNLKKLLLLSLPCLALSSHGVKALTPAEVIPKLKVPAGFTVTIYAQWLPNIRGLTLGDNGVVYAGSSYAGKVYAIKDANNDGYAETKYVVASGLNRPTGVAYKSGNLYVGAMEKLLRYDGISTRLTSPPAPVVQTRFPAETHHAWKYLRFGPDGKLYTTVGAPCNICLPSANHGTLVRLNPSTTSPLEILARGIRSSVGMDFQPGTNTLYFTDNGRDWLGDVTPPEELNRWSGAIGQHFGFPYCHGGSILDPTYGSGKSCSSYSGPAKIFLSHNAPLGIRFYRGTKFPAAYRNNLFVAFHGSWNKSVPEGYRVARVSFANGAAVAESDFLSGFLTANKQVLGRPADVLELPDGSVLISDDYLGAIYRVRYLG